MRLVFGGVLVAVGMLTLAVAKGQERKGESAVLETLDKQFQSAAEKASPSIACIIVSRSELYPKALVAEAPGKLGGFDRTEFLKGDVTPERQRLANWLDLSHKESIPDHGNVGGVVIDPAGLILTTYHAIEDARKIFVYLPGSNGMPKGSYADIYAADARSDLAVLKLIQPLDGLKAITMADVRCPDRFTQNATVVPGKLIGLMAFTYTSGFALDAPSIEYGSISKVCYRITPPSEQKISENYYNYGVFLEHKVKLNSSITGSVLINLAGEMVGLTASAGVLADKDFGPNYAIPMENSVRKVVSVLRRGEEVEYGFLGIEPRNQSNMIQSLTPRGPAEAAGLLAGDVVIQINNTPISSFQDLLFHVGNALAGTEVQLTVRRNLETLVFTATLGKFWHAQPSIASVRPEPVFGLRVDHLNFVAHNNQVNERSDGRIVRGVAVRDVVSDSPAARKFKTLGDEPSVWIITQVNGTSVRTPADFYRVTKGQSTVKLNLRDWSDTSRRELTLP